MKRSIISGLLLASLCEAQLSAQVIRDNRIRDLGVTPSIGRGYSVSANTFQSNCYSAVETTTPSYDFKYKYIEVEQDWERSFNRKFGVNAQYEYLFLKSNVDFSTVASGSNEYHRHFIFLRFGIDSYYHAMDEASSTLSDPALSLLRKGDATGFFNACGPYYVKGVGRHSNYMALLNYVTTSAERDFSYELKLKASINAFFSRGRVDVESSAEIHAESSEKRLQISVWAYGMGKDKLANLIATDIETFKETAEAALQTMQNPDVGIVTSMEVVPWTENIQFQDNLTLSNSDDQLSFSKRDKLEKNAEFVSEIRRIDRNQLYLAHKANNCRRILVDEYPTTGDEAYDPDLTLFSDLRYPNVTDREKSLSQLLDVLNVEAIDSFYNANTQFLYGEDNDPDAGEDGAFACIEKLEEEGLDNTFHYQIPACANLDLRNFTVTYVPFVDYYCMPEFSRVAEAEEFPQPQ